MKRAATWIRIVGMLALVVAALFEARPAEAQLSVSDTRCRRALHSGAQRFYRTILAKQAACHRQRMVGKLSARRDCNDPDSLPSSQILDLIESHLVRRASNACDGSPRRLGIEGCLAPCQNVPVVNFGDVGRCLACQAKAQAEATSEETYGTPPVFDNNNSAVQCQNSIGGDTIRYATSLMTSHRNCQFLEDRGTIQALYDCRTYDLFGIFSRAREIVQRRMDVRCTTASTQLLDGCSDAGGDEVECIIKASDQATEVLFNQVYARDDELAGKRVFITAQTYGASEIGGLTGADAICQSAAASANSPLNGTYKAWLGDGADGPATRFSKTTLPYLRLDGGQVADSFTDLVTNGPRLAIDIDQNGQQVVFEMPAWTGVAADGTPLAQTCDAWSSSTGTGYVGLPYFIGGGLWTASRTSNCGRVGHLYCFEQ